MKKLIESILYERMGENNFWLTPKGKFYTTSLTHGWLLRDKGLFLSARDSIAEAIRQGWIRGILRENTLWLEVAITSDLYDNILKLIQKYQPKKLVIDIPESDIEIQIDSNIFESFDSIDEVINYAKQRRALQYPDRLWTTDFKVGDKVVALPAIKGYWIKPKPGWIGKVLAVSRGKIRVTGPGLPKDGFDIQPALLKPIKLKESFGMEYEASLKEAVTDIDGMKYVQIPKSCEGISGSIAAAFRIKKRDGCLWVPTKRLGELKELMADLKKDLNTKKDVK